MSTNRDFDRIAAAWLAEGPSELADRVLDDALAEVQLTHQRRGPFAPWRYATMNAFSRVAVAVLVAAFAVGGAVYLLGRSNPSVASPTDVPSPSATDAAVTGPSAVPASQLVRVTSPVYGYTIGKPPGWTFRAAVRQMSEGEVPWITGPSNGEWFDSGSVDAIFVEKDRYLSLSGPPGLVAVAPVKIRASETAESASSAASGWCVGTPTATAPVVVGGEAGVLRIFPECLGLPTEWVTVVRGDRAFHIVWIDAIGGEAYGRAQFEQILATFEFGDLPAAP